MLKTVLERILRSPDVNTDSASSNESDVNTQDSSTAEQDVNNAEETQEESGDSTDDGSEETSEDATGEEESGDQQNDQKEQTEQTAQHEESVAYERFKEVNDKFTNLNQQFEAQKPFVEQARAVQDYLRQNNIPVQEYQNALKYLVDLRTNPAEAFKAIKPIYDQLAQYMGETLPPDLQAEVAAGTLAPERAKQIAQAQSQSRFTQMQQQWGQQGQQQSMQDMVASAINNVWAPSKAQLDPDFKEGTSLWEQTNLRIMSSPRWTTPQAAIEGCEKAYQEAKKFLSGLQPRTAQRQNKAGLQSRTNNQNTGNVVDTSKGVDDAARQIARMISSGVKPNQMRYS